MKEMYFHEIAVYRVPISIKKIKTFLKKLVIFSKKFLLLFEKLLIFFKKRPYILGIYMIHTHIHTHKPVHTYA